MCVPDCMHLQVWRACRQACKHACPGHVCMHDCVCCVGEAMMGEGEGSGRWGAPYVKGGVSNEESKSLLGIMISA